MKIKLNRKPEGIVLAVTLGIILIFAIILVGYVNMVNNQNASVARSQSWNQCIPVLENGIEEGLTQIYLYGTNSLLVTNNGWGYGTDGLYHKARTNSDGSYYTASLQLASNPIIISTGFVQVLGISGNVSRRVKVITTPQFPIQGGVSSKTTVTMNGSPSLVNSFNSSSTLYSSNGQYVPSMAESNAIVVADSTNAGAVSAGGTIDGTAIVGPGGTATGNITGGYTDDANVQFNDVTAPFSYGAGTTPASGTYQGTNYAYLLVGGNYNISSVSLSGSGNPASSILAVEGNCTLYVSGSLSTTGNGEIDILPGGQLTIYAGGTVSIKGNGVVNNSMYAADCTLYGLSSCTSIDVGGNGAYIGTVYAPEAAVTVAGNGGLIGAVMGDSVTISGNGGVHYDQALNAKPTNYVVQSWNEF